jgi:hypothetical protein
VLVAAGEFARRLEIVDFEDKSSPPSLRSYSKTEKEWDLKLGLHLEQGEIVPLTPPDRRANVPGSHVEKINPRAPFLLIFQLPASHSPAPSHPVPTRPDANLKAEELTRNRRVALLARLE